MLTNVRINGSITIENGGHLEFDSSSVTGDVVANPGGEFDSGATTNGSGVSTGQPSSIGGNVTMTNPFDMDIHGGRIGGNVTVSGGTLVPANFPLCGVSIEGSVVYQNISNGIRAIVGDPDGDNPYVGSCPFNNINGSVTFNNVPSGATLEGNKIGKNVSFTGAPSSDFETNNIGGNVTCATTTFNEKFGNNVIGTNNC